MIRTKIQNTIGLIEEVVDNRKLTNENQDLARRNNLFFNSLNKLSPTIVSYILVHDNFSFTLSYDLLRQMRDLMEYVKKSFDEAKAVDPQSFSNKVDTLNKSVSEEWSCFFHSNNDELINGMNIMTAFYEKPSMVRGYISTMKRCEKWPLNQEKINELLSAKIKSKSLLDEMKFDENIKAFLQNVSNGNATMSSLTPEIYEWICSENIGDKIALSIRVLGSSSNFV